MKAILERHEITIRTTYRIVTIALLVAILRTGMEASDEATDASYQCSNAYDEAKSADDSARHALSEAADAKSACENLRYR